MERITSKDVDKALSRVARAAHAAGDRGGVWHLIRWRPGDRDGTRYRLVRDGHELGVNLFGASQAYHTLHLVAQVLELTTQAREQGQRARGVA